MTDQKQLIKAINDLTKALNKNTESIKENTELSKLDINTLESGTPDDLNRFLDKNYERKNVIYGEKIIHNIQASECSINSDGSFGLGFEIRDHE